MTLEDFLKKLRKLKIRTKSRSQEALTGSYHSAFKGQGMLFSECRAYVEGDDVRYIDWNATARQYGIFVKQFVEERELSVFVVLDQSASMRFGSVAMTKADKAIEAMSIIAFSALQNNDKVGLFLFDERGCRIIPQRKGKSNLVRLVVDAMQFSQQQPPARPVPFPEILYKTLTFLRRRSLIFVISDFIEDNYETSLCQLSHYHEVIPVVVSDPMESRLPDLGICVLEDSVTRNIIFADTSLDLFTDDYEHEFEKRELFQRSCFTHANISYVRISTDEDIVGPIAQVFARRSNHV